MNDHLGRRRARSLVTGWLALPALLVTLAACGSVHAGAGSGPAAAGAPPSTGAAAPPGLPGLSLKRDPWLAYLTDVNPGSAIQFVTPRAGWRIDGQGVSNHLDKHLAAGPDATTFAWPGTSVSRSVDGGKTWVSLYSPKGGVWGIDFLSADAGWVVGVTTLARTTDGGSSWQRLAEPGPHPLVAADFVSPPRPHCIRTARSATSWCTG
jgi:hypothetical protein